MAASANTIRSWHRTVSAPGGAGDAKTERFLCSSDPDLIQRDALQKALSSDMLWWASALEPLELDTIVDSSVCLGIYHCGDAADASSAAGAAAAAAATAADDPPPMVGFCRIITDRVTFAYLTDVYVLPAYQRRGLGAWLMRCLRELLFGRPTGEGQEGYPGWPSLRSLWILASTPDAARMYAKELGAEEVARYRPIPGKPDSGMIHLEVLGPRNGTRHHKVEN